MSEARSTINIVVQALSATSGDRVASQERSVTRDERTQPNRDSLAYGAVRVSVTVESSAAATSTAAIPAAVVPSKAIPSTPVPAALTQSAPLPIARSPSFAEPVSRRVLPRRPKGQLPVWEPWAITRREPDPVIVAPTLALPPVIHTPPSRPPDYAQLPPVPPSKPLLTGSAASPPPSRGLSRTAMTAIVAALALLLFFVPVALLYHRPLAALAQIRSDEAQQELLATRQQAQYQAIAKLVAARLDQATAALEQLRASNAAVATRVESLLGQSFDSAIDAPPTSLRTACLASPATLQAWTDLMNARTKPSHLTPAEELLAAVASHIHQKTVTETDQKQLDQLLSWLQERQKAINAVNLDFLSQYRSLDARHLANRITATERR